MGNSVRRVAAVAYIGLALVFLVLSGLFFMLVAASYFAADGSNGRMFLRVCATSFPFECSSVSLFALFGFNLLCIAICIVFAVLGVKTLKQKRTDEGVEA